MVPPHDDDGSAPSRSSGKPLGRSGMLVAWLPAVLDALLIFFLSSRPRPEDDLPPGSVLELLYESTPGADKVVHFLSFLLFASLCSLGLHATRPGRSAGMVRDNGIIVALVAIVYAASDEVHQYFVPPRAPDLADFLVDCLGIVVGTAFFAWIALWRLRATRARMRPPTAP